MFHRRSIHARRGHLAFVDGLTIDSMRDRDRHIVALAGELDVATTGQLTRELTQVEASDAVEIVLDLERLQFIDSIGMNAIIRLSARLDLEGKWFVIRRGPDNVHRCFELCGLTSRLRFIDADTPSSAPHTPPAAG